MSQYPTEDSIEYQKKPPFEYWVGGSLPLTAESYIKRAADDQIVAELMAGTFCYVLNSRQMGKSSLRVRTMARLQVADVVCISIDITEIGSTEVTAEQFYFGILWTIVEQTQEQTQLLSSWDFDSFLDWWNSRDRLPFVQRWVEFIRLVMLDDVLHPIAIFIDEIDSTLSFPFDVDDFFAAIRACYNRRVDDPRFNRLTFALFGVCSPSDLIQDKRRTPFNVGQAIELTGFSYEEAIGLAKGLPGGEITLKAVLAWTGGQPFLTQRVCRLLAERSNPPSPLGKGGLEEEVDIKVPLLKGDLGGLAWVDAVVMERIISVWESQDEQVHFRTIQDRILADESIAGALLGLYGQVLAAGAVGLDVSAEQLALRLTGVVVKRGDKLVVANRIYQEVFDGPWVTEKLTALRPYGEALKNWVKSNEKAIWLLKGDKFKKAQDWANEKDRKLTSEDYRFILASSERENKILVKKIKDSKKKVPGIRAGSISVESQNTKIESYERLVTSQQRRIEFQAGLIASQLETIKTHKNQINIQAAKINSLERTIKNIRESISIALQKEQYSPPAPKDFSDLNRFTSPEKTQESQIFENLDRLIISIPRRILVHKESIINEDLIPDLVVGILTVILFFYLI